jgi:hypothetical protein
MLCRLIGAILLIAAKFHIAARAETVEGTAQEKPIRTFALASS